MKAASQSTQNRARRQRTKSTKTRTCPSTHQSTDWVCSPRVSDVVDESTSSKSRKPRPRRRSARRITSRTCPRRSVWSNRNSRENVFSQSRRTRLTVVNSEVSSSNPWHSADLSTR